MSELSDEQAAEVLEAAYEIVRAARLVPPFDSLTIGLSVFSSDGALEEWSIVAKKLEPDRN